MDSWCRICSRSDEFRRFPLFVVSEVSQEVIANMIMSCTDTQVSGDDGLPQQICPDCLITLCLAYSFRKLCRRTDAKLRETGDGRTPSFSTDHFASMRRSQSQLHDESAFSGTPVIKEEVEYYEYDDCDTTPQEDQWVIQNPRTIQEGVMAAAVHSAIQYEGNDEHDPSTMMPLMTMSEGLDPAEYGESSGMDPKGERWKKKPSSPERFSKRIRRQSDDFFEVEYTGETKELEVLKTSRGKDLLTMDGYMFYKNSQRGSRCYWECRGQTRLSTEGIPVKCPARVTTDFIDNKHELLAYKKQHTHPPNPSKIQQVKQRNMLKQCAASDEGSKPSEIMRQVHDATMMPDDQLLISKEAQRKIIKRARGEEQPTAESLPLQSVEVPLDCLQTVDGSAFFHGSIKMQNGIAFLFTTLADMQELAAASFWWVASTLSAKTGLQRQLLTIHGSLGPFHQQAFPTVYVLMSATSEALYRLIFLKIKQLAESMDTKLSPQLILTDFEKPLVNALEFEFPHSRQSACFFYFARQLSQAVEAQGLAASFDKNHWLLQNFKRVKALPFLPPEHIPDAFYVLKSNAPLELHRFLDEFAESYIFGKMQIMSSDAAPMRARPAFSPSFWSIHTNIMQGIPSTYQHTKEWHYRMARLLTAYHSDPHNVFRAYRHEYHAAQDRKKAVQAGLGPSKKTEDDHRNQAVRHIATNFTSYSTLQFLDAIADNLEAAAH